MLAADTPVFVYPGAWTTVGELSPGDLVYGPDGAPRGVLKVSRPALREVRRVTTKSMGHLDVTLDHELPCERYVEVSRAKRWAMSRWAPSTSGRGWTSPALLGHDPIQIPHRDPGFSPYTYGRWLGDGSKTRGLIVGHAVDDRVALLALGQGNRLRHNGGPGAQSISVTVPGLTSYLRSEGLIWSEGGRSRGEKSLIERQVYNDDYVRWRVLQGLMDSDGGLQNRGAAAVASAYPRIWAVIGLLLVLDGVDFSWSRREAYRHNRRCRDQARFTFRGDRSPFLLSEHKVEGFRPSAECAHRDRLRSIRTWEALPEPRPCVDVEVEGRVFLAGHELHQVM